MRITMAIYCLLALPMLLFAQNEKRYIREGNELYQKQQYKEAEDKYAEALKLKKDYLAAYINKGSALYQQDSLEAAASFYELAAKLTNDPNLKAQAYHNLGNSYVKAGKYAEGVEAYKNALRNNPNDQDTRYNLAYAQGMIKKQPPQDQQKQQQDKDQDPNKDKQGGQKNKDPQKNDQIKDEQGQKSDQPKDPKQGEKGNPNDAEKPKDKPQEEKNMAPKPGQTSKADLDKQLDALKNEEMNVQMKLQKKEEQINQKTNIEKDW